MEEERRRYLERRERIRRRKRARRIRGLFLLVVLVVAVSAALSLIGKWSGGKVNLAYANEAQWYVLDSMDLLDQRQHPLPSYRDSLKEQFTRRLVKGGNYVSHVEKYAFDTGLISDIIERDEAPSDFGKWAFLTFDDGPNETITPQILDTLEEKDARATFFVVGGSINEKDRPMLMRQLIGGNSIAMHSHSHNYKKLYPGRVGSSGTIAQEADLAQESLKAVLGEDFHTSVWRYPGGHMSWKGLEDADEALAAKGIHWVDWNSLTGDAEPKSRRPVTTDGFVDFMNRSARFNEQSDVLVVLMHDAETKQGTADALGAIIDELRDQGYEFGILK
ncbi:MAG: polysaccharide deacetylase family protein [Tissierellia bacterium]|nr:polysaccharide deacetylase family protein [Tissierellia bacterium]